MEKMRSFFDGESYKGYKVHLKLVREGIDDYLPAQIHSPEDVYHFMGDIRNSDRERLYSLHLDASNTLVNCEEVSCGTVESTIVHPREIFKSALLSSCSGFILVHNHPTGDVHPSTQDRDMTMRLYECANLLGITFLDSIIIGPDSYYSFKEYGLFDEYKRKDTFGDRRRSDGNRYYERVCLEM